MRRIPATRSSDGSYRGSELRKVQPVFQRVLDCFDTKVAFAEAIGESRQAVNHWCRMGYIPAVHAMEASRATGNRVGVIEILTEANRQAIKARAIREAAKAARAQLQEPT